MDDCKENEDNGVVDCNMETSNASDDDNAAETILLENNSSNGVDSNAAAVVNRTTLPATRPPVPKTSSKLARSSKKFVNTLTTIPLCTTLESHLYKLKERRSAHDSFTAAINYPIKIMEDRFSKLELEGRPVQVLPYASAADCNIITDALNKFDPDYSIDYRSKSLLKKMPIIASFINCPKHCRMM